MKYFFYHPVRLTNGAQHRRSSLTAPTSYGFHSFNKDFPAIPSLFVRRNRFTKIEAL